MRVYEEAIQSLIRSPAFSVAYGLARQHRGKVYLTGGHLFRRLAHARYGTPPPKHDLDFLVEELDVPILPSGWEVEKSRFGNPKYVNGSQEVDVFPLDNIFSIKVRGLEPSLEAYLSGVPLTIQSLVYDFEEERLVGDAGLQALEERRVAVNNPLIADLVARTYGTTINGYVAEKAASLDFLHVSYQPEHS